MAKSDDKDLSRPLSEYAESVDTVIPIGATLQEAIHSLRNKTLDQKIIYFYVIDENWKLKGVISTRQLLLSDPNAKVSEVMQAKVAKLHFAQTLKEALEMFDRHPLLALPVVDDEGKLLGAISVQTVTRETVDFGDQNSRSAIFQMIGLTIEEGKKIPLSRNYRLRMPWLLCNVFSGLVCAVISRIYELVLSEYLLLAFFIPLVLTLSESASMQSMTQSLAFLRRPRFNWRTAWQRGLREWQLVIFLAISCGVLVGCISMLWKGGVPASMVIGIGIMISVAISAAFGILLPIVIARVRLDPRVASGPVVLMITDMLTTGIYLSLATWWLL